MLALFRSNQVTGIVWVVLYAVLLRLPVMAGWLSPSAAIPAVHGVAYDILPEVVRKPGLWSSLLALVLVIIQAILLYDVVGRYRLLEPRNWLPALAYVLIASSLPEFGSLSAPLVAVTFLPLIWGRLFSTYKKASVISTSFDVGFLLGLSVLFYPPTLVFLAPVLLGLRSLRSFNLQERVLLVLGVLVPVFLWWTWAFWFDHTSEFWSSLTLPLQLHWGLGQDMMVIDWIKMGLWGVMLLIVVLSVSGYYYKKLIQTQKFISIILWSLSAGILAIWVFDTSLYPSFLLSAISLGVLIGHTMSMIRSKMLAEVLHWSLLAGAVLIQLFPFLK